jgi:hypothetical protein
MSSGRWQQAKKEKARAQKFIDELYDSMNESDSGQSNNTNNKPSRRHNGDDHKGTRR